MILRMSAVAIRPSHQAHENEHALEHSKQGASFSACELDSNEVDQSSDSFLSYTPKTNSIKSMNEPEA